MNKESKELYRFYTFLRDIFSHQLRKHHFQHPTQFSENYFKNLKYFENVIKVSRMHNVDPEAWILGQFIWNLHFVGRPPSLWNLADKKSFDRYLFSKQTATPNLKKEKEKMLELLSSKWGLTREEVLERFAPLFQNF